MTSPTRLTAGLFSAALAVGVVLEGAVSLWVQTFVHLSTVLVLMSGLFFPSCRGLRGPLLWGVSLVALYGVAMWFFSTEFLRSLDRGVLNELNALTFFFIATARPGAVDHPYGRLWPWMTGSLLLLFALLNAVVSFFSGGPWDGFQINPNVLAAGLLISGPPAIAVIFERRKSWGVAAAILFAAMLFMTGSRAALGAFSLLAVLLFSPRKFRAPLLFFISALLFSAVFFYLDADRVAWWKSALVMLRESGGVGIGTFGEAYPLYRAEPFGQNTIFAHNFALEALAERGPIGGLLLFLFLGAVLFRVFRRFDEDSSLQYRASAAGLLAFLAHGFLNVGFSIPGLSWFFWAMAGDLCGRDGFSSGTMSRMGRAVLFVGALAAGVFSLRLYVGDEYLFLARSALKKSDGASASSAVEKGLFWNRREPELFSARAAVRASVEDWEGALSSSLQAVRLAPGSARFRAEAAEVSLRLGRRAQAVEHYREAVRLLPLNKAYSARLEDLLVAEN